MLYENEYKYILSGIDIASRHKIARPMRTKQAKDVTDMIANIFKVSPLTYPKVFQCDDGSEFKAGVTKLLEKHRATMQCIMMKYQHTHMAFVEAVNKLLAGNLFKFQDAQFEQSQKGVVYLGKTSV